MKSLYLAFFGLFLLLGAGLQAHAQCGFTPTVTPNNLIMCPNTQDTIWTQAYDSYQWYKDNVLVPGATSRYYVVDQYQDAGSEFSVIATQNGCAARSVNVMVDGWAFASLSVMLQGGATGYATDPLDGHIILCDSTRLFARDTVIMEVMQPYRNNIEWKKDGLVIPGATGPTLRVTETGSYEVSGAPSQCKNFRQQSLPMDVEVRPASTPVVSLSNGQLIATPPNGISLNTYQWYLNGTLIPGATQSSYTPMVAGTYWVQAQDAFCYVISAPFAHTVTGVYNSALAVQTSIYPNPAYSTLHVTAPVKVDVTISSITGQTLVQHRDAHTLNIQQLPQGIYLLTVRDQAGQTIKVEKLIKAQ